MLKKKQNKLKGNGNIGLNSSYKRVLPDDPDYFYIPIISTNNIRNFFYQTEIVERNIVYKSGGLKYLSKYINILRDEFGRNRILYLDAGDHYNKTNSNSDSNIIENFFNSTYLNATILNNSQYTDRIKDDFLKKIDYQILGNDVTNYKIYNIHNINGDTIKIGVIGLMINYNEDYQIEEITNKINSYINAIIHETDAIILLTNIEIKCSHIDLYLDMYKTNTQKCDIFSTSGKTIFNLLEKISSIDAIILSNSHNTEIHYWANDIPIMSSPSEGKYFNIMYLPFKKTSGKYSLNKTEIKIEGPLPICEKIFNDTKICNNDIPTDTGELINYAWHGKKIY
jgi:hypothetical protein